MADMSRIGTVVLAAAAISLAGCSTHREFRVASVGSDGSFEIAGDEDSSGSGGPSGAGASRSPLVTSGNLLVGGGGSPTGTLGGTVIGTVAGQTVVQLAGGTIVLLDGFGGTFGDSVAIDLHAGRVVAGPVSLLGTGVLDAGAGVRVATGGAGSGGSLVQVGGGSGSTGAVTGTATGAGTVLSAPSATGSVTGSVANSVTGTLNVLPGRPCC